MICGTARIYRRTHKFAKQLCKRMQNGMQNKGQKLIWIQIESFEIWPMLKCGDAKWGKGIDTFLAKFFVELVRRSSNWLSLTLLGEQFVDLNFAQIILKILTKLIVRIRGADCHLVFVCSCLTHCGLCSQTFSRLKSSSEFDGPLIGTQSAPLCEVRWARNWPISNRPTLTESTR